MRVGSYLYYNVEYKHSHLDVHSILYTQALTVGQSVNQENTSDKQDIPWYITREHGITNLYHAL